MKKRPFVPVLFRKIVPVIWPPKDEFAFVTSVPGAPVLVTMPPLTPVPVPADWLERLPMNCAPPFRSTVPAAFTASVLLKASVSIPAV